ncbi:hypothetical protein Afil01_61830 [Actinorhabdospora filicis]|uniref:Major facilitator superfamily (MFS) profile domain-containing protein n=1 Tax=Actinorhabdospora filicis TaxID=1785913 RepID=A0A9W6SS26_9ACTN|nr:hypothetical protein Afil01_61830 [Actinorhabdospora filicis]
MLAVATLLISAAAESVWQLAAGRFLDGLAAGMVAVSINAAIAQSYPAELRARMLSLMSAAWIVPSLAGPPLASLIVEVWSWRAVFYGLAALTAIPALVLVYVLGRRPGSIGDKPPRPALLPAIAVSLGAALGQYAVSGRDWWHLASGAVALALVVAFVRRLVPTGTWRAAPGLPASVLLRGFASGSYFTLEAFVPLLMEVGRPVPTIIIGISFTGGALAWAGASWLQAHPLAAVPRHRLVSAGASVMGLAVLVAGSALIGPAWLAGAAYVLAAVGMGLLAPSLTLLALGHAPADRQGQASSAMQTTQNLGQITVMAVGSALFTIGSYPATFALLLVPVLGVFLLAGRTRAATPVPAPSPVASPSA